MTINHEEIKKRIFIRVLILRLAQTVKEAPKTFAVPAVHPLGVHKLNGFVSVSTEAGISVKTESFDGLTEVPAAATPVGIYKGLSEQATLAFKFLSPDPTPAAAWKLGVATEQLESWVRAEVVNLISVSVMYNELLHSSVEKFSALIIYTK